MPGQLTLDFAAPVPPLRDVSRGATYTLIRSRRRTISIEVYPQGEVRVRAPQRLARHHIDAFVTEKQDWIARKQEELAPVAARVPERQYRSGERYLYLGETLALEVVRHVGRPGCFVDDGRLKLLTHDTGSAAVRSALVRWYDACARQTIPLRVERYAPLVSTRKQPASIQFRENKRRWGSCNATTRSLNFNVLLMMAPMTLIDYVVVHELCHLLQPNHSPAYWAEVARVMPDYDARRDDLKAMEPEMVL